MLFNSVEFFLFFPIVTALYFLLPQAYRWFLLLTASCVFYMAFIPKYILILFVTITVDYAAGIFIEKTPPGRRRRLYFIISLVVTVAILFVFKYFNFFNDNIARVAQFFHWNYGIESLKILLPIGLSFHTFQSMSYVIEVYRGNQKAERHFGIYALYVMFYPQLVAGPIERPQNLLHQFYEHHQFDYERVTGGLKRMAFGFFKKVVIADGLAAVVDQVYSHPQDYAGFPIVLASACFAYQIYCDFSGYSDIAIGSAQVMGFRLMENFNRPYAATSVTDFWRRWHISLSTWFRDYVYIPLGGNRVAKPRWYWNIFLTFLISGLWHGANWTFVIWGSLNGLYIVLSLWTAGFRDAVARTVRLNEAPRLRRLLQIGMTFMLVCFTWLFFRANTLSDALYMAGHFFHGFVGQSVYSKLAFPGQVLLAILFMEFIQYLHKGGGISNLFAQKPVLYRWSLYYALIMITLIFGTYTEQKFIYFQF